MESWSLKAAGGFLAALLLTGSGFQLLGTPKPQAAGTGSEQRQTRSSPDSALGLQGHPRHKRHTCKVGYMWYSQTQSCCKNCPAGQFMTAHCTSQGQNTVCERCPQGTYLSYSNLAKECKKCSECFTHASQVVLKNCTETSDVVCGCQASHFQECTDRNCQEFTCRECRRCKGRVTRQNCSAKADTQCGDCMPGFYLEGNECRACTTLLPEKCIKVCGCDGNNQGFGLEYVLLGLMGPLFLGALFIFHRRRTLSVDSPAAGEAVLRDFTLQQECPSGAAEQPTEEQGLFHLQVTEVSQTYGNACPARPHWSPDTWTSPAVPQDATRPLLGTLQQGSTLYTIINAVPVRRWKELMRVLELPDAEIEVVEMEFAHVRDQQYEMLKRWCQQKTATLESIFSALEHMELAGCAEELRQRLQSCP